MMMKKMVRQEQNGNVWLWLIDEIIMRWGDS